MGMSQGTAPVATGGYNNPIHAMTTRAAVAAGDLVTLFEDGKIAPTNADSKLSIENSTTEGLVAVKASEQITGNNNYTVRAYSEQVAWLGSGNYVTVYTGDGANDSTSLRFRIKGPLGSNISNEVVASSAVSILSLRVAKLNATQFVLMWGESTTLKFAIYNNDGSVAVAAATIATMGTVNPDQQNMTVLAGGDIVFAYNKVTSQDLAFKRYNASGVLQGAETVIDAASQSRNIAIKAMAGGDFVVFYHRVNATSGYKFARYNASGALQGSLVALGTFANTEYTVGKANGSIAELSNGNIVMAAPHSATTDPSLYIYSSANALVKRVDMASGFNTNMNIPQIAANTGGFVVVGMDTTLKMQAFDNAGNTLIPQTNVGPGGPGSSSGTSVDLYNIGVGYVVAASQNNSTSYAVSLFELDNQLAAKGSAITVEASGSHGATRLCSAMSPNFLLAFEYSYGSGSLNVKAGLYKCARSAIFGVAKTAAAAGAQAEVNTVGNYIINQQLKFNGMFDAKFTGGSTLTGNRGMVAGNNAMLLGLV